MLYYFWLFLFLLLFLRLIRSHFYFLRLFLNYFSRSNLSHTVITHHLLNYLVHENLFLSRYLHIFLQRSRWALSIEKHATEIHIDLLKFPELRKKSFVGVHVLPPMFYELQSVFKWHPKSFHYIHDHACCRAATAHRAVHKNHVSVLWGPVESLYLAVNLIGNSIVPILFPCDSEFAPLNKPLDITLLSLLLVILLVL